MDKKSSSIKYIFSFNDWASETKCWIALGLLILFHLLNNYFWLRQDCESLGYDVCHHINIVVSLQQQLRGFFSSNVDLIKTSNFISTFYNEDLVVSWPKFTHLITALLVLPFKDILFGIRFLNVLYFILMIVSIYLIGRKIHSSFAGLISAYLISFYLAIFGLSRKFGLDFPLTAIVCLIIYFLIMCDEFKSRRYAILLAVSLGLGMLIKGQCIFYVIGPLIYVGIKGFKKNYANIIILVLLALVISLIWWHKIFYTLGLESINNHILHESNLSRFQYRGNWQILKAATYYSFYIARDISLLFAIMFLSGAIFFIKKMNRGLFIIFLWLCVSYLAVSLIPTKNERYIFPAFGAIALISAIGWIKAPFKRNLKIIVIWLFIFYGILQFFNYSWYKTYPFFTEDIWCHPPKKNNHRLVTEDFNQIIQQRGRKENSIAFIEEPFFHADACVRLGYFFKVLNQKNKIYLSAGGIFPVHTEDSFLKNSDNYNFLIAFSQYPKEPNFGGLLSFSDTASESLVFNVTEKFKKYSILKTGILLPERVYIYLLER